MKHLSRLPTFILAGSLLVVAVPEGLRGQDGREPVRPASMETRIWMDRGVDPVFQSGDRARIYYRASADAYVAMFQVDTDGVIRLLFPTRPDEAHRVRAGRDYRLLFHEAADWLVDEAPGVGYFFLIASERPFDFDRLVRSPLTEEWELARTGVRVQQDPYVAMDGLTRILVPSGASGDFALDFTAYHVGQAYSYPRFLCYTCHAAEPFESWNPYRQSCPDFRVVIYNDPYYYPASRYQGNRVVFPRSPAPGQPQFAFKERGPGEPGTPLVQSRPVQPDGPRPFPPFGEAALSELEREFLMRLGEAGATLPPPGTAPGSLGGPRGGGVPLDPRVRPVLDPPADGDENRPVLQRRTSQP